MKAIILWASPVAIAVVGLFPWLRFLKAPAEPAPEAQTAADLKLPHVETGHAQKKTIARKLRLPGEVRPNREVAVYARIQGYVEAIGKVGEIGTEKKEVDRGTLVETGQVLAWISVPEMAAQLKREEAEQDWRQKIWKRLKENAEKTPDLITQDQLDDAKGRADMAEADVNKTNEMIAFATIKAPFSGVISERWVDPGNLIQPAVTKMFHLVEVETVRVRIAIPQSDVPAVREDSMAEVAVDELPGKKFTAKVSRLFFALNKETKTMAVEIDIKNENKDRTKWVRPGMFARVTIDLDQKPNVLVLPASALVVEKKSRFVFLVKDGIAKKTAIEVGWDNGIEFEVKSGLTEADDVVVAGKNLIGDGDKVRATPTSENK